MSDKLETITTPTLRLAFPNLVEPTTVGKDDTNPRYRATLIIPNEKALAPIQQLVENAWKSKFPGKAMPKVGKKGNPIHPHDDMAEGTGGFDDGTFFIRASTKYKPGIVDRNAEAIVEIEDEVYAGSYVRVQLTAMPYDHDTGGKGVSLLLGHIQKVRDGERLDGRKDAEESFAPIADGDDDII